MKFANLPANETERLEALKEYHILDTKAERSFDELTELASKICETPIALISLVDNDRQWFKSKVGLDASQTPREIAFCAHAILEKKVFIVPHTLDDERFYDNPLVVSDPKIRFYAGAPLVNPRGFCLGTLCIIDRVPHEMTPWQAQALEILAKQVVIQLELRRHVRELSENNAKLKEAHEAALEGSRAKSSFLSTMSHEIRTPLNGLVGMTHLLMGTKLTKRQKEYAEGIQYSTTALLELVNNVLDFSKLEFGKMTLEETEFSVSDLIQSNSKPFLLQAKRKGLKFSVQMPEQGPVRHKGDPVRVRQVLNNLLGNAVKFTEKGSIIVRLSQEERGGNEFFKVIVRDTGIGIPPSAHNRIFSSFSQADNSTTRKYGGSGLGLAICKQLVDMMGGEIGFESIPGKGSGFWFTFPSKPSQGVARRAA